MKSSWSQGPISQSQASLSHELWKVPQGPRSTTAPSRPPPGLTNSKPSSTWSGNSLGLAPGWNGSYSSGECSDLYNETYIRETPDKRSPTWIISDKRHLKMLNGEASFFKVKATLLSIVETHTAPARAWLEIHDCGEDRSCEPATCSAQHAPLNWHPEVYRLFPTKTAFLTFSREAQTERLLQFLSSCFSFSTWLFCWLWCFLKAPTSPNQLGTRDFVF